VCAPEGCFRNILLLMNNRELNFPEFEVNTMAFLAARRRGIWCEKRWTQSAYVRLVKLSDAFIRVICSASSVRETWHNTS
jgi:hypothetical protein